MIGQLRGKLIEKQPPFLMIDVQGVGYLLQAPLSTCFALPPLGEEVVLRTHMIVREDAHLLFGFLARDECQLFQEILKISGIGPKIALAILSALSVLEFSEVVRLQNIKRLQGIPGIGAKMAQRIMVEMPDRLVKWKATPSTAFKQSEGYEGDKEASYEAITALITLGYKPSEAQTAVSRVQNQSNTEQLLKEALQGLAKV